MLTHPLTRALEVNKQKSGHWVIRNCETIFFGYLENSKVHHEKKECNLAGRRRGARRSETAWVDGVGIVDEKRFAGRVKGTW